MGAWVSLDTSKTNLTLDFIDGTNVSIKDKSNSTVAHYRILDSLGKRVIILMKGVDSLHFLDCYSITFLNPNKLEFESLNANDNIAQFMPSKMSFVLVRKKN